MPETKAKPTENRTSSPPEPTEPKPIMSADHKLHLEPPNLTLPKRGPQSGSIMNPLDRISAYATPVELERWCREMDERRAKDAKTWVWQRCDNRTCGLVMKVRPDMPDGGNCPNCNWMRIQGGGHLHRMTEAETNTYLYEQAERDKAVDERLRRAAFYKANARRGELGLPPWTYEQFLEARKKEYAEMIERDRRLGEMAAASQRRKK